MQFRCEDLPQAGIVLIPHDSPDFAPLLADITRHIESPPPGGPPPFPSPKLERPDPAEPASAILWNRSDKPLCAHTLVWKPGGIFLNGTGVFPSLLLPFGLPEERRAFEAYWRTILPQSKRWVSRDSTLGSNADVRPPAPEEIWKSGIMGWGGAGGTRPRQEPDTVTLTIDAAMFATGECAGPDTRQLWDQVVPAAEVTQQVASIARGGLQAGLSPARILADVEQVTGKSRVSAMPPPPPPFRSVGPHAFREYARQKLADRIARMRKTGGDETTVATLSAWADAVVPKFRRI
jgi:hypothetical protein